MRNQRWLNVQRKFLDGASRHAFYRSVGLPCIQKDPVIKPKEKLQTNSGLRGKVEEEAIRWKKKKKKKKKDEG